jgi:FtsP/CotA-like multicopper oxidase with cupredoxin domain
MDHSGMNMGAMGQGDMMAMPGMDGMAMDLNDYNFDAYLANDRTLDDPEVVQVDKGGKVLVRVINAAAATVFWIDTGALPGRLVAVDGEPVQPLPGNRFGIAMGQRLDIELDVPAEGGAFPILALREGAKELTGLVLATPGATVTKLADMSDADHPAFSADLMQEAALRAVTPLPERAASSQPMLMLGGSMMPYVWTINGQTWGKHSPVTAKTGERVEIMFHNMSMMAHPMHLHGHAFQVVGVGQNRIAGAVRDTVHVPPMGMVTVAVDAGEAARWMLHCHHMPHLSTGMMTEFAVSA